MYLGLDLSTQSLTAMVIDTAQGAIAACESVHFGSDLPAYGSPSGFIPGGPEGEIHADPCMWLEALDILLGRLGELIDLTKIRHVSGSGQQHGSVYLDGTFEARLAALDPARLLSDQLSPSFTRAKSPIWMDTSTGEECAEISAAAGGPLAVCSLSGSVAIERFTGPQIRKFYKDDPASYARTAHIHLVSSFLASVLCGKSVPMDLGDAAGMNLLNLAQATWDSGLLKATAPDLARKLLTPVPTIGSLGNISPYFTAKFGFSPGCRISPFTGDNPASLVGMGAAEPGTVVISLGTSDTLFAAMPEATTDPDGYGHVFGNPNGNFMSLICFRNGSLAREALRDQLETDWAAFDQPALSMTRSEAGINLMLPFYGPEITPRHDFRHPVLHGSAAFESGQHHGLLVRALLEGQFLNMRLHSRWMGVTINRIRITGGASKNTGIAQIAADVFQAPVERLEVTNSAALGAALIAAASAGEDLAILQSVFCRTTGEATLKPNSLLGAVYDAALTGFEKLLGTQLGTRED